MIDQIERYGLDFKMFLYTLTFVLFIGKTVGWWTLGWVWVFAPLWMPIVMALSVLFFLAILFLGVMGVITLIALIEIVRCN